MKTEKKLLEIAKEKAEKYRFDEVEDLKITWKGFHVFEGYFKPDVDGNPPCTGLPQFILLDEKGNEYKEMLSDEETFEIMDLLPDKE